MEEKKLRELQSLWKLMFDHFFDCLSVNSFIAGKFKRKPFQDPYRSPSDFRLKVRSTWCLFYIVLLYCLMFHAVVRKWFHWLFGQVGKSVRNRLDLSRTEQNSLLLSPETRLGLRTTYMHMHTTFCLYHSSFCCFGCLQNLGKAMRALRLAPLMHCI